MIGYTRKGISQTKLNKLLSEQDKYCNTDTGECLDLLIDLKESTETFIKLNYNFTMINKEIEHKELLESIGATYYGYLWLLISNMKTDNSIDYSILGLNESGLNKLKGVYKKNGVIKYGKFSNMKKGRYFCNPYISSYGRNVMYELVKMFEEDNHKLYGINLLNK